jgi:hypothetical protein
VPLWLQVLLFLFFVFLGVLPFFLHQPVFSAVHILAAVHKPFSVRSFCKNHLPTL